MNEFKKNGEWYSDPTAYNAIQNADKPLAGEIYTINRNGLFKTVLIIAANGDVCNIVELIAEEKEGTMPVRAKAMMYTNPRMLQYTFVSQLGDFVRKLSYDEFLPILDTIEDALHILIVDRRSETPAQTPVPAPEPVMVTDPVAEVEARIYKQLYNDLLEKVLKHG